MADNYLERRMDDYRAGRLGRPAARVRTAPADAMILRYPPLRVFIAATDLSPLLSALLAQMRAVGLKVAFTAPAGPQATAEAQKHGARFYPAPSFSVPACLADLDSRWGGVDHVVSLGDSGVPGALRVEAGPLPCGEVARLTVFLLHPDNAALLATVATVSTVSNPASGLFSGILWRNPVEIP